MSPVSPKDSSIFCPHPVGPDVNLIFDFSFRPFLLLVSRLWGDSYDLTILQRGKFLHMLVVVEGPFFFSFQGLLFDGLYSCSLWS